MTCSEREPILHVCLEEKLLMHLLCWLFQFLHLRLPSLSSTLLILKNRISFSRCSSRMPRGSVREGKCINEMSDRQCYLNHLNGVTRGITRALCCFSDLFSYLCRQNQTQLCPRRLCQRQPDWNTQSESSTVSTDEVYRVFQAVQNRIVQIKWTTYI